jgi:lipopolysaccharide/colanic/teichoic acid biosynthesis glycosyltransferase
MSRDVLIGQVGRLSVAPTPSFYVSHGKRAFDVLVAGAMLFALWPLMLVLVALIAADGGRPIFSHERVGHGGRRFGCLKLRSMVTDAGERLKVILATDPAAAAEWARDCKLTDDPRVTPLGGVLRSTSLDELPQLWNVIRGDMSLVGPRPITRVELDRYGEDAGGYLAVRPGLTGEWQVSGRNDITYAERVRLDTEYGKAVSFPRDVRILFMTVGAVLGATGR